MKYIYTILLFLALGVHSSILAQENNTVSLLNGTWVLDYEASINLLNIEKRQQLDTLSISDIHRIEKVFRNRKVTFLQDGTYHIVLEDGRSISGIWTYFPQTNQIELQNASGEILHQKIVQITTTYLQLSAIGSSAATMLIDQWYFTKL